MLSETTPAPSEAIPAVPAAATPAVPAQPAASPPSRPDGLADDFFDAEKGVKFPELLAKFNELGAAKAEADARKAAVPEKADGYQLVMPEDFKLPEGWELKPGDPMTVAAREFAHKSGLTQAEFSQLSKIYVQQEIARNDEMIAANKASIAALGANGTQRVTEVLSFIDKTAASPEAARQVKAMLVSKEAVEWAEGLMKSASASGPGFTARGREEGRKDGRPDSYDKWSAIDRRTFDLAQLPAR